MSGVALARLAAERSAWRKDHPHKFVAKPETNADGSTDLMRWRCVIPGKEGTPWAPGEYHLKLTFSHDYPARPPVARFDPPLYHPNFYDDGKVCLDIINDPLQGGRWAPCITIRQILIAIQELFDNPNNNSAAQYAAHLDFGQDKKAYVARVKAQTIQHTPRD